MLRNWPPATRLISRPGHSKKGRVAIIMGSFIGAGPFSKCHLSARFVHQVVRVVDIAQVFRAKKRVRQLGVVDLWVGEGDYPEQTPSVPRHGPDGHGAGMLVEVQ